MFKAMLLGSPIRLVTWCLFEYFFPLDISLFQFVNHSAGKVLMRQKARRTALSSDGEMQCSIIKKSLISHCTE